MSITVTFNSFDEMVFFAKQIIGDPADGQKKQKAPIEDKKQEVIQKAEELPKGEETEVPFEEESTETKAYTLEEVRAELARLTRSGKQKQVKDLISSFGAKNLSGVDAKDYAALMEKAGAI